MKRTVLLLEMIAALFGVQYIQAQEPILPKKEKPKPSLILSSEAHSEDIRLSGGNPNGDGALRSGATLKAGNLSLGLWNSADFPGVGDPHQVNYSAMWNAHTQEFENYSLSLGLGGAHWDLDDKENLNSLDAKLSLKGPINMSLLLRNFQEGGLQWEKYYVHFQAKTETALHKAVGYVPLLNNIAQEPLEDLLGDSVTFGPILDLAYSDQFFQNNGKRIAAGGQFGFKLGDSTRLFLGGQYQEGDNGKPDIGYGWVKLTTTFNNVLPFLD